MLSVSDWTVKIPILVDSKAAGIFIDEEFVKKLNIHIEKLSIDIEVYNVDRMLNINGSIMKKVVASLELKGKYMEEEFLVTAWSRQRIILGYPALSKPIQKLTGKRRNSHSEKKNLLKSTPTCLYEKQSNETSMKQLKIWLSHILVSKYKKLMIVGFENNMEKQLRSHLQLLKVLVKPCLISGYKTRWQSPNFSYIKRI